MHPLWEIKHSLPPVKSDSRFEFCMGEKLGLNLDGLLRCQFETINIDV